MLCRKKVFFCFDYKNDMDRVLAVRDGGGLPQGGALLVLYFRPPMNRFASGLVGCVQLNWWIARQIEERAVTVVLIDGETLSLHYIIYSMQCSRVLRKKCP